MTDWGFAVLASLGMVHKRTITSGGSTSGKMSQFAAVNTRLGNLKTTIKGTYHSFDFAKYAHRYLGVVQYLFNRRVNLRTILQRLLVATVTTPPRPGRVLRQGLVRAEVCR